MPSKYADRPYPVGKGKPPVATQFGKDRPGNTKGRPRGAGNADKIVSKVLAARLTLRENDRKRTISKMEALVLQLVNQAASGNLRAIELVLRLNRDIEIRTGTSEVVRPLAEADRAVLEAFADRIRGPAEDGS